MEIDRKVCNHIEDLFKLRIRTRGEKRIVLELYFVLRFGSVCVSAVDF